MKITKGMKVEQVLPAPIVGTVDGFAVDQETGNSRFLFPGRLKTGRCILGTSGFGTGSGC